MTRARADPIVVSYITKCNLQEQNTSQNNSFKEGRVAITGQASNLASSSCVLSFETNSHTKQYKIGPPFDTKQRAQSSCPGHAKGKMNTIYLDNLIRCVFSDLESRRYLYDSSKMAAGLAHRGLGVPRGDHIERRGIIMCPLDGQTRCGQWGVEKIRSV